MTMDTIEVVRQQRACPDGQALAKDEPHERGPPHA